jgi:hypothetical protein
MIRALLRFIGYLGLSVGFVVFAIDGARYIANNELTFLPLGNVIDAVVPHAYAGWQEIAKQKLPAFLWDPVLVKALAMPFFAATTVIGVLLLLIGRKPKPEIGYSNRD